jgi:hypothetical protein
VASQLAVNPTQPHFLLRFSLLRQLQSVVYLDAEVTNRAFELGVAQEELYGAQVLCSSINQRRFGAAYGVGTVSGRIEPNLLDLGIYDPSVLPGAQMRRLTNPAWKEEVVGPKVRHCNPAGQSGPCRLSDFELHRSRGFLLHDDRPRSDSFAVTDVSNSQLNEIAGAQLAVYAKIEQRQFPRPAEDLKPNADGPNFFKFERRFLTDKLALIPRSRNRMNSKLIHGGLLKVEEP